MVFRIELSLSLCVMSILLLFIGCNSNAQSDKLYVIFEQWLQANTNILEGMAVDSSSNDTEFQISRLKALLAHVERSEFDSLISAANCERKNMDQLKLIKILFLPVEGEIVFANLYIFLDDGKNLSVVFKMIGDSSLFVSKFSGKSRLLLEGVLENAVDIDLVLDRPAGLLSQVGNEGVVVNVYRYDFDSMNTLIEGGTVEQVDFDCDQPVRKTERIHE